MVVMLTAARGGNRAEPTLTFDSPVAVEEVVTVIGEGFPKNAATFLITDQVSPIFSGAFPTILVETDRAGSFEVTTSFSEPGTYEFHVCSHLKKGGGSWDCRSLDPQTIEVTP